MSFAVMPNGKIAELPAKIMVNPSRHQIGGRTVAKPSFLLFRVRLLGGADERA
jgi:hypothetical protein